MKTKGSQETVPASYVQGLTGKFESLPERSRYLTLSVEQVLDRLDQPRAVPVSAENVSAMAYCNEQGYNFKVHRPSKERMKVLEKLK